MNIEDYGRYLERKRLRIEKGLNGEEEIMDEKEEKYEQRLKRELNELDLPRSMLKITYTRSSGAGGQNVNKVSSKAVVKLDVEDLAMYGSEVPKRLRKLFASKINKNGELLVTSELHRDQDRNLKDAIEKIKTMICEAKIEPREKVVDFYEEAKESKQHRIDEKRRRSEYKSIKRDKRDW